MPLSSGLSIHDDTKHKGSAKRDTANGIAALDASGNILAKGESLYLSRNGGTTLRFKERDDDVEVLRVIRLAITSYQFYIRVSNVMQRILSLSDINVANGIAGLDASAEITSRLAYENIANGIAGLDASVEIPVALLKTNVANGIAGLDASADVPLVQIPNVLTGKQTDLNAVVAKFNYSGNSSVNRAAAHGLGVTPKLTLIKCQGEAYFFKIIQSGYLDYFGADGEVVNAVTAADATNIYVGNIASYERSANLSGKTYEVVVIS